MGRGKPSTEFRTFDFGAHLHPASVVPEEMAAFDEYVGAKHTDVDACAEWFDAVDVDGAALSQPYFMGHGDADATAEANDALLDAISGYPEFYGLAAIPTAAGGQAAAAEFERCLEEGYHGGALETKSGGIELDDPEAEPILEVADRTGVPVLVHPKLNESLHPDVLDDRYRLNAIFGREAALAESIFKVVHEGVLDRYPDLTLVYHHLGGNVAAMLGRVHLQLDAGRWPGQDHVLEYEEFKTRLENRIYYDTSGFFGYRAPLETTLREIPSSQVLFGTDSPYEARTEAEYRELVETVDETASNAGARKVLSDNALELLDG